MIAGRLTTWVSEGVAALLPLLGYPVDLVGSAMMVKGHILDVSEGCSGLRSFQTSLMLGVFLGEFYRLASGRRLVLVGIALGLAILGNGARIFYLTRVAYREGPEAEAKVHDPAGLIAIVVVYAAIGWVGWWLSREKTGARVRVTSRKEAA
jgi:exosortase/archaeosortase family protein